MCAPSIRSCQFGGKRHTPGICYGSLLFFLLQRLAAGIRHWQLAVCRLNARQALVVATCSLNSKSLTPERDKQILRFLLLHPSKPLIWSSSSLPAVGGGAYCCPGVGAGAGAGICPGH